MAVDEDGATGVLSARRLVIRWNNAVNDGFDSPSFVAVKNCQEPGRSNSGAEDGKGDHGMWSRMVDARVSDVVPANQIARKLGTYD